MSTALNARAAAICDTLIAHANVLRVQAHMIGSTTVVDCGCKVAGGLEAGRRLAEICLAGLAQVEFVPGNPELWPGPAVQVRTDHPVAACMASQYAGWEVKGEKFFAMGSGPMRAVAGREDLFAEIGHLDHSAIAVGVLETRKFPPEAVIADIARKCQIDPSKLTLLIAPTASLAGTIQVVARSIETALHKLYELDFDLRQIVSGYGIAPLPPVAHDDLAAIGRTNDAILYGGEVTLWVHGDDETVAALGPKVPSCASRDHGRPFAEIFAHYGHDFYKIDPHLFSPAVVTFCNVDTGKVQRFGHACPRVIHESFGK